jgi:putative ABC transport system permease protein
VLLGILISVGVLIAIVAFLAKTAPSVASHKPGTRAWEAKLTAELLDRVIAQRKVEQASIGDARKRERMDREIKFLQVQLIDNMAVWAAEDASPGKGYVGDGVETEHDANGKTNHVTLAGTNFISPDYFRVARIAFVEGRAPDSLATPGQLGPGLPFSSEVVVNRTLARRLWPDGRAIGARVRSYSDPEAKMPPGFARPPAAWSTVVGVVDDIQLPGLRGDTRTMNVYSLLPPNLSDVPFVVRTAGSAEEAAPTIHRTIVEADRRVLVRPILSGEAYLRDALAPSRFAMALLAAFAVIALVLSAVGLYGIIAYSVTLRTREIGVRIALGADSGAVTGLVIGGGLRLAVAGVVIGAAAAAATTRLLGSMLYGVSPADPLTFVAIAVLVAVIASLASYLPARRAPNINPTEALRAD